jgi:L-threonylcarbamoyladenylate synthase
MNNDYDFSDYTMIDYNYIVEMNNEQPPLPTPQLTINHQPSTINMTIVSKTELIEKALTGQVVSFPTDTVPALAVLPQKSELIFQVKKRSQDKPLILMVATVQEIWQYVTGNTEELAIWKQVANQYLPGALTLVLPSSSKVPPQLNPQDTTTIGVRVPDLEIAQEILAQTAGLATTSANISGQPPLRDLREISNQFPQVFALDYTQVNKETSPSTVIKWTGKGWEILRQGKIKI